MLPEVLGRACAAQGLRLVTAESCTAGLVAKLLTDADGSSAWLERGLVTYSNEAKIDLLDVPEALLAEHGAVSEPVAEAMVRGALARSRAELGVSLTGIAGPKGGTPQKPVGTVCVGWGDAQAVHTKTYHFPFDRDRNRLLSAWAALGRLYRFLSRRAD
jgi:nicotinamide-nucleotide amidase